MRTKTILLGAAIIAAGALTSMAQSNVFSLNVVGYINRTIPGNAQYALVANQLDTGNNVFTNLFQTLPVGSKVLKWTGVSFSTSQRVGFGSGWSPAAAGTNTLNPGEGAFVQSPTGSAPLTNTFVGNVPGLVSTGSTNPTYTATFTNAFGTGFSMRGDPEPEASDATTLGLTAAVPALATNPKNTILIWNEGTQSYSTFTRVTFGAGWTPSVPSLQVGQGFFFNTTAPGSWTHTFNVN
jgi:hypothetical protein